MNCKYCQKELPSPGPGGHRRREFCDRACKQAHYRATHPKKAAMSTQKFEEAKAQIEELELEVMRLTNQLDLERRYLEDEKPRSFKAWLKKQPSTPFIQKVLADKLFEPRDTRGHYEYRLRIRNYTEDEIREFVHLWKRMLVQQT